jgi:hypothetical protein
MVRSGRFLAPLVLLAIFGSIHHSASAQIILTEADIRAQYRGQLTVTTFEAADAAVLQPLAQLSGANRTWDLTIGQFNAGDAGTIQVVSPPVPGSDDPDFASANLIIRFSTGESDSDSLAYTFARLEAGGLYVLGMYMESDEEDFESLTAKFRPPYLAIKLPLTFGTTWTSSTQFDLGIPEWPGVQMQDSVWVDGWGTLVTPHGSAPALRVVTRSITVTKMEFPGMPPFEFRDTTTTIEYTTRGEISASLVLDETGNVSWASYTVTSGGGGVAREAGGTLPTTFDLLPVYPNPFNPEAVIPFTLQVPGHATLQVHDLQGRIIDTLVDRVLSAGHHEVQWRPSSLASGTYIISLTMEGRGTSRRVSLVK